MGDLTRRALLGTAGGVAGTMGVVGVAGCSSLPFLGDDGAESRGYTDWLYEPDGDADRYTFFNQRAGPIRDHEDELPTVVHHGLKRSFSLAGFRDLIGVDFDELDEVLHFHDISVVTGQYDASEVETRLTDDGYDAGETHGGYTLMTPGGGGAGVGVSEEAVVRTSPYSTSADPTELLRTAIGARQGDEDRFVDVNDDVKALTDGLGSGHLVQGGLHEEIEETDVEDGRFGGQVGVGTRFRFDGSTTGIHGVYVFADESDVDATAVDEYFQNKRDAGSGGMAEANSLDTRKNGRTVVVDIETDTADVSGFF